ncbi:hypothetical protein GGH94_002631 [Coemansia aciculifera]|uniref:Dynamitin n=1 Tax=Coemansia aciculifera TaxID=417176 RepID=A0A9W8ILP2_9FUNG|nr:hypothetical protein GGH94_002631 [Coemansia aciculifera]KAJ2874447.1 hypothetical protein GGH93_002411 [Coemansia aciculifera]
MSASVTKYSNLLDIDTSQPDVYETPDVPVIRHQDEQAEIPLSEDISIDSLSVDKASARFRASARDTGQSALSRYQRSLFRALQLESLSDSLEVSTGSPLNETPEQRLRRLVYETQELREQLVSKPKDQQTVALMKLANGLTDELAQLSVQSDRESAEGGSLVSRSLWQRLSPTAEPQAEARPSMRPVADNALQLEARISMLEKVLGSSSAQLARDAAVGHSLVDSVSRLRQQLEVLADPQRVDGIQRRIKQVLLDMDRLDLATTQAARTAETDAKGAASRIDPATVKRIDELYEKFTGIDSLIELAPATARRLQSLATLHGEAAEVVARVGRIEREQAGASEEINTMKEIAGSLKNAMADNSSTLAENMKHLDSRIYVLNSRLDSLRK